MQQKPVDPPHEERNKIQGFFHKLGPGVISGAADDDPSGISTYSVAGAAYGFSQLWTALLAFPMMAAVQLMCAQLGMVSGEGLAGVIRKRYPAPVLWVACLLLIVANVVNIGADLAGMAEGMEMMTGVASLVWIPVFALIVILLLTYGSYRSIVRVFKWLTLVLFAYVISAFLARPHWGEVFRATVIPSIELSPGFIATFIAILGTTISPYLFFWQAAQEVEEERSMGRTTLAARRGATGPELRAARTDVLAGTIFAGVIMYFIIVTTGATLHTSGAVNIQTAREAAEALKPFAGDAAYLLFTLGLVGTGMLGVPVLAGSAAYVISEAMSWRGSLNDKPGMARKFYLVLAVSVIAGAALDLSGINAVRMLFLAAVVNGVLAPPLIILVVLLTGDRSVMGEQRSSPLIRWIGWITAVVMTLATIAMFITM